MKLWRYILGILFILAVTTWVFVFSNFQKAPDKFKIIACDVGQGDAILATLGNIQILTDGGPSSKVINCLEKYMPTTDREIELVVLTHNDRDHFLGLIDVFKRYKVINFLTNGFDKSTQDFRALTNVVGGSQARIIYPEEGMVIRYGLISLDILWPRDLQFQYPNEYKKDIKLMGAMPEQADTNSFSIVTLLNYKDFDALLTGDLDPKGSDEIAKIFPQIYQNRTVEFFKIPHHGSKNGMTENLLKVINPKFAIISAGKNNSYGHPHKEIMDLLSKYSIQIRRTDEEGDLVFEE